MSGPYFPGEVIILKKAKKDSYTVVYTSSVDFQDKTPYVCAILETEEGSRVPSVLNGPQDSEKLCIGQEISLNEQEY